MKKNTGKKKKRKYQKAPPKKPVFIVMTSLILTAAFFCMAWGLLTVDQNSREVGWNQHVTELAFWADSQKIGVTISGHRYSTGIAPLLTAEDIFARLEKGREYLNPEPVRMTDMLFSLMGGKLSRFADIARAGGQMAVRKISLLF